MRYLTSLTPDQACSKAFPKTRKISLMFPLLGPKYSVDKRVCPADSLTQNFYNIMIEVRNRNVSIAAQGHYWKKREQADECHTSILQHNDWYSQLVSTQCWIKAWMNGRRSCHSIDEDCCTDLGSHDITVFLTTMVCIFDNKWFCFGRISSRS